MSTRGEVALIDLSSIAHPIWHMSQADPDPNHTSQQIVARVHALTTDKPHAAICCDSGRSFRKDVAASYKANRPESEAPLQHQILLARERLEADGYPVWAAKGFEADDLIATACAKALSLGLDVLIVSADKDLLQLVGPGVRALSSTNGTIFDADAVVAKFGVRPDQMRDYLTLVGDASDNVKGANRIGPKRAAELLATFNTLDAVYAALDANLGKLTPGIQTAVEMSLKEFRAALPTTRTLITLRTDVDVPFETIAAERVPAPSAEIASFDAEDTMPVTETPASSPVPAPAPSSERETPSVPNGGDSGQPHTALAVVHEPDILPVAYERQLDPRSLGDARRLATDMYQSRLHSAYGTPQGVLATIMLGRELGLPAMASLRSIHVIEGRQALSAALMVALVLKSGFAEYFEPVEFDDKQATFVTKRIGARKDVALTHTIEMAKTAGLLKPNSNWEKIPTDMLVARAQARLCRLIYPDVVGGLYTPDELRDAQIQKVA